MRRTVPQLTKFLANWLELDRATVGYVTRKCREAMLLSPGRPGRGAAAVTSEDAATVLLAILSADRPLEAAAAVDALRDNLFSGCASNGKKVKKPPEIPGLPTNWYRGRLLDALTLNIDARIRDSSFRGVERIAVTRGHLLWAKLDWWAESGRLYEFSHAISTQQPGFFGPPPGDPQSKSPIVNIVECRRRTSTVLGDWLKGDDTE